MHKTEAITALNFIGVAFIVAKLASRLAGWGDMALYVYPAIWLAMILVVAVAPSKTLAA